MAAKMTPHGLPDDVLVHALDGYLGKRLSWPSLRKKGENFHRYISPQVNDCTIRQMLRRPTSTREPAISISIYRLTAKPLRKVNTLFGANIYTFTFWRSGVWFLSTNEPFYTTEHIHERFLERASNQPQSLAAGQDSLSILWPTLIELGQQRRRQGRWGNVTYFLTPLDDGLVFGDMEKMEMNEEIADAVLPVLLDCEDGVATQHKFSDPYSNGIERLFVCGRTFVGGDQMKEQQIRLKKALDEFIRRHAPVLECIKLSTRLAFNADAPYGRGHFELHVVPQPTTEDFQRAFDELDQITTSDDWAAEINRSIESRASAQRRLSALRGNV